MIYKLSFENKEEWENFRIIFLLNVKYDKHTYVGQLEDTSCTIVEIGYIPIPATYNEDGEELTPLEYNTDYAVDIYSDTEMDILNQYILTTQPDKFYHNFSGVK